MLAMNFKYLRFTNPFSRYIHQKLNASTRYSIFKVVCLFIYVVRIKQMAPRLESLSQLQMSLTEIRIEIMLQSV